MSQSDTHDLRELTGLAQGLLADGALNDAEIRFLHHWLAAADGVRSHPRVTALLRRIRDALADGVIDEEERADLRDTLAALGEDGISAPAPTPDAALPLTEPPPALRFEGARFCFTGTFGAGGRKSCEARTEALGAICGGLLPDTDYLVIGSYAASDWTGSGFARKIAQARQWADEGHPIAIISEDHWAGALNAAQTS